MVTVRSSEGLTCRLELRDAHQSSWMLAKEEFS